MSSKVHLKDNSVLCLIAPTASGKTALAYDLYDTERFELISVDSALIYRDMNIGTAKPTLSELQRYPHYLVDIINPDETYSVASFVKSVESLIEQIHDRGKIPLLVGGTMMYFVALFEGLSSVPDSDPKIRQEVEVWRQNQGIEVLYSYLMQIDPIIAKRLSPNDTQRITRAIEVYRQTDRPLSDWQKQPKKALIQNVSQDWQALAVTPDRAWLHQRIEQRLSMMWQQGLLFEVIGLWKKYSLDENMPSMRSVGYRQAVAYLKQINHPLFVGLSLGCDFDYMDMDDRDSFFKKNQDKAMDLACQDMKNKALYATRQLAKRQYTWLRRLIGLDSETLPLSIWAFDDLDRVKRLIL